MHDALRNNSHGQFMKARGPRLQAAPPTSWALAQKDLSVATCSGRIRPPSSARSLIHRHDTVRRCTGRLVHGIRGPRALSQPANASPSLLDVEGRFGDGVHQSAGGPLGAMRKRPNSPQARARI
jgi:hypothetical protein